MSITLRQKSDEGRGKTLVAGLTPVFLRRVPSRVTEVVFSNGSKSLTSCIRCHDAPCIFFGDEEVRASSIPDFPADRNPNVCAAGAISRPAGVAAPVVDKDACMLCGVCAARCPVGAIRMVPWAIVEDEPNVSFLETADNPQARMETTRSLFIRLSREGSLIEESDAIVDDMRVRLLTSWARTGDRFPNHLARNLLLAVGIGAAMRRKGDNAARMDLALGPPGIECGCAEVEFTDTAVLDAPRDLLDDVAVLEGRLGRDKRRLATLIVSDVLPNRRSEYWRIIQDVARITKLRVGTVTILALILLVWNLRRIKLQPGHGFYVDVDTDSYRTSVLEPLIGRPLRIGNAPRSYVDVAK